MTTQHPVLKTSFTFDTRNFPSFSEKSRFVHRTENVLEGMAVQLIFRVFSRINVHADRFCFLLEGNPESLSQLRPPSVSTLDIISVPLLLDGAEQIHVLKTHRYAAQKNTKKQVLSL